MRFFDYTSLNDEIVHGLTLLERIIPLLLLALIIFLIVRYGEQLKTKPYEKWVRYGIALLMLIGELSYMAWNYYHSQYNRVDFFSTLPFHLCSYAIWGLMISLAINNDRLYKTVFVFGIIGVLALLFPNLNHGVNSFRYYQLYFSHSLIFISMIYMYKVFDYYPTLNDLKISFIVLQVIIVLSLIVNILFNAEFLFIGPGNKPIDFAWEWPLHMIQYECIMLLFYTGTFFYLRNLLKLKMD